MFVFLKTFWLGALSTFKMWFDEYFLKSWYCNCERSMKIYYENVNVQSDQTFLQFVSKKINNHLDITSVFSIFYLWFIKIIPYSTILLSMEWFPLNQGTT